MSDFYKTLVKELNNDNTVLLSDGGNSSEVVGWIDTGSYALNALCSGSMYGGIASNKITALAGEPATGKTFFSLGIVNSFLEKDETAGVNINDTESAITKKMMKDRGIDPARLILSEPSTVQEFRHGSLQLLDKYMKHKKKPPLLMVLDSVGQLSTTKEVEDTMEGKETKDMSRAALLKATFRVLNLKLAKAGVALLVTNHVYDVVGSMFPTKEMSGGSGLKYSASTILFLSKSKDKDGTEVVGNIIRVRAVKSRFSRENKTVQVRLSYDKGLDRYYGLLPIAEKHGLIKKVSTRFEMPDGSKAFEKAIYKNPEKYFTPEFMEKLELACNKEFQYGLGESYEDDMDEDEEYDIKEEKEID